MGGFKTEQGILGIRRDAIHGFVQAQESQLGGQRGLVDGRVIEERKGQIPC